MYRRREGRCSWRRSERCGSGSHRRYQLRMDSKVQIIPSDIAISQMKTAFVLPLYVLCSAGALLAAFA